MSTTKPDWWPTNPYPEDVFPMTTEQFVELIPDENQRAAISGCLGRMFWNIASESIWSAMQEAEREERSEKMAMAKASYREWCKEKGQFP